MLNEDMEWLAEFVSGTKPEWQLLSDEIQTIRHALVSSIDRFEKDYVAGYFMEYVRGDECMWC